ncbi:DNA primase [Porphyrobacter algicida]|uniref:DNA primase n=1 Tax=Qipengyuania algicida TaxID=1836209 RepID=A0A845AHH2_9SPHN|nr:DNA primase [Qipengyuania algicida]MXP28907.1 DNA primase [Qipengyuania algicida]
MALSPQWLDQLRSRITLSAVIGRNVRLQKAGREFKACCPFHDEKSPSFTVNDAKGFYHCFGCGAHGDAIRWLTDHQGMGFMDAVKELAAEAGLDVPAPDPRVARQAEKRASLHDVTAAAQEWFVGNLRSADGATARSYLERRGITDATIREFGFGFAPDNRQALKPALSQFEEPMLVESGMRIAVDDKEPYDRFRGRLMLPIQDARGRVIAFGGRILDADGNGPKYLNSPDTPLFDKGRTLYNLHRAAPAARKSGRIVVVEGYMDVVALAQAGIAEAVAPLGTALTEHQLDLLWRQVERPILCFDGDAAGQRAAMRAIERALPLLRPAHSLGIVQLPAGVDPDDLIREQGAVAIERLLSEPMSLLDALWHFERDAQPLASPEAKAGLKARLMDHTDTIEHPDIKALYRRELLERFSAFAFPPRERKPWQPSQRRGGTTADISALSTDAAARLRRAIEGGSRDGFTFAVLSGLARLPDQVARHEEALIKLARRDRNIAPAIDSLIEASESLDSRDSSPISMEFGLPAPPEKSHFAFLDEGTDPGDAREELAEAVSLLVERPALEAALVAATKRFERDPEGSIAEQGRLRERLLALNERVKLFGRSRAAMARPANLTHTADTVPADAAETE